MIENPVVGRMRIRPFNRRGRRAMILAPNETFHRFTANLRIQLRQPEVLPLDVQESIDCVASEFKGDMRRYVRYWLWAYVSAQTYGEVDLALGKKAEGCRSHCRDAAIAIYQAALGGVFKASHFCAVAREPWFRGLVLRLIKGGPSAPDLPPAEVQPHQRAFGQILAIGAPRYEPSLQRRTGYLGAL